MLLSWLDIWGNCDLERQTCPKSYCQQGWAERKTSSESFRVESSFCHTALMLGFGQFILLLSQGPSQEGTATSLHRWASWGPARPVTCLRSRCKARSQSQAGWLQSQISLPHLTWCWGQAAKTGLTVRSELRMEAGFPFNVQMEGFLLRE